MAQPDAVFAALGDPTRRALLERLSVDGPLTATELAPDWPISRQALVKHLGTLAGAGLVDAERRGREVRYQVVPAELEEAAAWLREVGQRWDERLDALARHLLGGGDDPDTGTAARRGGLGYGRHAPGG